VKPTSDSATPAAELRCVPWPSEFRHSHGFDSWPGSPGAVALAAPCMVQGDLAIGVAGPHNNLVSGLPDTGRGTAPADLGWRTAPGALGNRIAPADLGWQTALVALGNRIAPAALGWQIAPVVLGSRIAPAALGCHVLAVLGCQNALAGLGSRIALAVRDYASRNGLVAMCTLGHSVGADQDALGTQNAPGMHDGAGLHTALAEYATAHIAPAAQDIPASRTVCVVQDDLTPRLALVGTDFQAVVPAGLATA
jgi:hypothetical protein